MRQLLVLSVVPALLVVSCSRDPEVAKRQYLAEGDEFFKQGKVAEAILQYRNALEQDGRFGEARFKLAAAYEASGNLRNALREAVRAADLMPDDVPAQLRAARFLVRAREFDDAKVRASAVLQKEPRNVEALVLMGNALAGLRDFDGAIEQAEQAIEAEPQALWSYANLGFLQVAKGDRDAALSVLQRAVEIAPSSPVTRLNLANFYWAAGEWAEAERELAAAFEADPKAAAINRVLGAFYMTLGRLKEAEGYLKTYAEVGSGEEPQLMLADYYMMTGRMAEARKQVESLHQAESVPASIRVASIDFREGRRADAYQVLERILQRKAGDAATLELKARFLMLDRKPAEALAVLNPLVEANPKAQAPLYLRGAALEGTGSIDAAIAAYREFLQVAPTSAPGQLRLANLYLIRGSAPAALDLLQGVVKARPRSAEARFLYAQALLKTGELRSAERELTQLVRAVPSSPDVHTWMGMLYETRKDLGRARQSYEKALELQPNAAVAFAGLVSTDIAQKRPDAARARLESKLAEHPKDPALLLLAATTYLTLRDLDRAESAYGRLLEVDTDNLEAYARLGGIYLVQNRLEDAKKSYLEAARHDPRPVVAKTMVGMILTLQNQHDEARKQYEEVLAIDGRAAVAANNLAWLYAERGENLEIAQQLAQTAKTQLPERGEVSDTLGWIYYKRDLAGLAVTTLGEAAKQSPANAGIHYRLGLAHLKNGDKAGAKRSLEHALELDPQFRAAADARRVLATINEG